MDDVRLVLASASPRRRELLALTGIPFVIDAPEVDETCDLGAKAAVAELSRRKALAAAAKHPGQVVLASDTLVAIDDAPLGKPRDEADAVAMLRALSGRAHRVHTGVCVCRDGQAAATVETTTVHFAPIPEEELLAYVRTPEPYDKAGAYAIQGRAAVWCSGIEGCYYNIMGLPVHRTAQLLRQFGAL